MAFAGLRKQINKANQYMSEKIGGAEGTKLTEEFQEMERRTDLVNELVEELILKTKEYLQPNPASRAKLMVSSKLRGQGTKSHAYTQPEGTLGEAMIKYSKDLGEESLFARSLDEMGESLKQMAEIKYALEDSVKQNFLEPLHHLQSRDLKDVMHHRKKLQGRRLDYDCKKRKQAKDAPGTHAVDEEIRVAEDKFEESFNLASMGMFNLLENDVEQISQLTALAEALQDYHQQCGEILQVLVERMQEQKEEAINKPKEEYQPKKLQDLNIYPDHSDETHPEAQGNNFNGGTPAFPAVQAPSPASSPVNPPKFESLYLGGIQPRSPARSPNASPLPSPVRSPARTPVRQNPCCQALYDFDPENEGEIGFKEGEIITLITKIDDNWYEGTINGKTGLFPVNYVQVMVPLP